MSDEIIHDHHHDGIDRRGFLNCMAWAGTGVQFTVCGGVLRSHGINQIANGTVAAPGGSLAFVQISDNHIGFNKAANNDVVGTLQAAVDEIHALPAPPAFLPHTGDLSHLSKASEFDTLDQVLKSCRTREIHFVPGEHDVLNDNGRMYRERYGQRTRGNGWYSFDSHGVHFIGLVNVLDLKAGGLGSLGQEQLDWLTDDVRGLESDTPIVVLAHIPLWTVYPDWGWNTDDSFSHVFTAPGTNGYSCSVHPHMTGRIIVR